MALEIQCPGCGRTLRVANEHAGKQVRCPACQQISVAPPAGEADPLAASAVAAESERPAWHLRTPEGQTFGPITWQEVQAWATEGRISADCKLADSDSGPWQPAAEWFPQLRTTLAPPPTPSAPTAYPWTPANPFSPAGSAGQRMPAGPAAATGGAGAFVFPHRGGLILVLGLLGFMMTCPILSLMAWVMGSHDLREMRAGRMDASGEGLTQAGTVLGMILSLLAIIACVLVLFVILLAAVAGR